MKATIVALILLTLALAVGPMLAQPALLPPDSAPSDAAPDGASPFTLTYIPAVADASVANGYPNMNFGGEDRLHVLYFDSDLWGIVEEWSLLRFSLSLPANVHIDEAHLVLWVTSNGGANPAYQFVARVMDPWNEGTVTWGNKPNYSLSGAVSTAVGDEGTRPEWDVTAMVQGWYKGTFPNYGLVLRPSSPAYNERLYGSRESNYDPMLRVSYSVFTPTPAARRPSRARRRAPAHPAPRPRRRAR